MLATHPRIAYIYADIVSRKISKFRCLIARPIQTDSANHSELPIGIGQAGLVERQVIDSPSTSGRSFG